MSVRVKPEAASRSIGMVRTAMGPAITGWLEESEFIARIDGLFCEAPKTFDDVEGLSDSAKRRGNAALNKLKKSLDDGRTDLRKIAYLAEPKHAVH